MTINNHKTGSIPLAEQEELYRLRAESARRGGNQLDALKWEKLAAFVNRTLRRSRKSQKLLNQRLCDLERTVVSAVALRTLGA